MLKTIPKIPSSELNEHTAITGRNRCERCKKNAEFLYNGLCAKCLRAENPTRYRDLD